jgi:hypothetical protein
MGIDYDAKLVCGWRVSTEMVTDQCEDIDNLREGIEEGSAKLAYASPFFDAPNHYLHWFVTINLGTEEFQIKQLQEISQETIHQVREFAQKFSSIPLSDQPTVFALPHTW